VLAWAAGLDTLGECMGEQPQSRRILRFRKTERHVHWAVAIPFLVCYITALILVLVYNPNPQRPYRDVLSWTHRLSGIALIVFPLLAITRRTGDIRIHFYNILQAWTWTRDDLKWLALAGLAAVSRKVSLPDQGKFNAAEKLNFMTLMGTYPLYIVTGIVIWLTDGAFLSWLVHFGLALIATPLILGHVYMAMFNPGSRIGLSGMITGFVDRRWARHHYRKWYREQLGEADADGAEALGDARPFKAPGDVRRTWSAERRAGVVLDILEGNVSRHQVARDHGIDRAELQEWIDHFVTAGDEATRPPESLPTTSVQYGVANKT
jgi:formate dehydrogenase subunit gamma